MWDGRESFHPRIDALKKKVNELLGDNSYIELVGNITLLGSGPYVFTPERVSGYPSVFSIELTTKGDEDETRQVKMRSYYD